MHTCIVCGNKSICTKVNRPGVFYHRIPTDEYMRRKWLKVFGIDHCYDWQRICSDHFLKENYKPGKKRFFLFSNTIPQPYDKNFNGNGFPSNYASQSNAVKTGNNEILPMEQNIIKDKNIENAVVNNFESLKRSSRLNKNNADMSNKNMLGSDKNFNGNGFPSNYASQNNAVKTGNNEILPMEQNIIKKLTCYDENDSIKSEFYRDKNIENAVVNNFESLRRSSRLNKNNADMSNKNMLNHKFGSEVRCSVKNCFNMLSKRISLFGYPKDFMLRKKWIENSGIKRDPAEIIPTYIRVCSTHFEDDCFKNIELKNRLKPDAVPTLFFDDDIIDTRKYISSVRFPDNRSFDRINTPSCSNVESDKKPLSAYMDTTARHVKDYEVHCSIPVCITNTRTVVEDIFLFTPTMDCINEWSAILGMQLTLKSVVCERHFRSQDLLPTFLDNCFNDKFKSLAPNALPLPINEVTVLSTCNDQFISPIDNKTAEQSSEEKKNNALDNTHNTSMMIDDSSSKSPLSITLETIDLTEPSVNLSISPENKSNSSELIEIKTPATSKCISLPKMSVIHKSNSGYSARTSQSVMLDVCNTEQFTKEKNRFIFELSKKVVLPNLYWKTEHLNTPNTTSFYQQDINDVTVKKVRFFNNLVPIIQIYGKKYKYNTPITTEKELDDLLDKIDSIQKCYGSNGFVFEQCKGYFDSSLEDMCSGCQEAVKNQDLQRMNNIIMSKNKTIEGLKNKIATREKAVFQLKKSMAEMKRKRQH